MSDAPCPICSSPLERVLGTFYCSRCEASLQPKGAFAASLDLSPQDVALIGERDRHSEALTTCALCQRGALHPERLLGEAVATCDGCHAVWIRGSQLVRMRARLRRDRGGASQSMRPAFDARVAGNVVGDAPRPDMNKIAFDDVWSNAFAYPVALAFGVLAHLIGLSFLVWGTVEMWFHELGHAVVAWLSGFFAIPLPFVTLGAEDRSTFVIVLTVAGIAGIAYGGWRYKMPNVVVFAGCLLAVEIYLTFVLNARQARQWEIFAGQAGAIVLPTLVMLAFYQPIGWRWDFWRYVAVVVAAVGLVHALFIWIGVARGTGVMPHGSAVGDDSQGDLERLVRTYKWTLVSLAHAYITLCVVCLLALGAYYAVYLRRALAARNLSPSGVS